MQFTQSYEQALTYKDIHVTLQRPCRVWQEGDDFYIIRLPDLYDGGEIQLTVPKSEVTLGKVED